MGVHEPGHSASTRLDRVTFTRRIDANCEYLARHGYALVYLHVCNLDHVSRLYGIETADGMLEDIMRTVTEHATHELVTRHARSSLAFLASSDEVEPLVTSINERLRTTRHHESLEAKVGYVTFREGLTADAAIEQARFACEQLRHAEGVFIRPFDEALSTEFERSTYVIDHLDDAIAAGEIRAYAQPIHRILTGRVCEVEILARWESERLGILRPDDFVPILERNRLVHKLDLEIVRLACKQWSEARELGVNVPFGVNVSRLDFELCDIYARIRAIMERYEVPVDQVHIEITETSMTGDDSVVTQGMRRFHEAGFRTYMDDFGTGYSSLGTMASMRFDVVKLDKKLVDHVEDDERARVVLADTVGMVKRLGMQTLCEGVETADQLSFLRAIGCEKAQGFFFDRPLPHERVMERLRANRHAGPAESADDIAYYNSVGQINLLDGTSVSMQGIEAATFSGRVPIAVLEFNERGIDMLMCNFAYQHLLEMMGFSDLDSFVAFTSAGEGRVNARAVQAAERAAETGTEQSFDFIVNDIYCSASLRQVARSKGRQAFLNMVASVRNAPQITDRTLLVGLLQAGDRMFFWKDAQRRYLGANRQFLEYHGLSGLSDILGRTARDMGWVVEGRTSRDDDGQVLAGREMLDARRVCLRRGELRDIVVNKRPLYSNGAVVGLVGYFDDLGPHEGDASA